MDPLLRGAILGRVIRADREAEALKGAELFGQTTVPCLPSESGSVNRVAEGRWTLFQPRFR